MGIESRVIDFGQRVQQLRARLARVNAALCRWDEYDAMAVLPSDLRREVRCPTLTRAALKGLQARLVGELGCAAWADEFQRRMPFSRN